MSIFLNQRGYAIISAISVLLIVGFLSTALFVLVEKEVNLAEHEEIIFNLQNEAEASLILAIARFNENKGENPLREKLKVRTSKSIFLLQKEQAEMDITTKVYGKQKAEEVVFLSISTHDKTNISTRLLVHLKKTGDRYKIERWEY